MGCWNQTCSITNLPIKYKDKIVVFPLMLLNNNLPSVTYNIDDKYSPFCVPIIGEYNDYGGIENVENENYVMSILLSLKFFELNKNGFKSINFTSCEDFLDALLEKTLYITIDDKDYKVDYMMLHYNLYYDLINEISIRNINCDKNKTYRLVLKNKICNFIDNASKKKDSKKTKKEPLDELKNLIDTNLKNFDDESKQKVLKELSSPSCFLKISKSFPNCCLYDFLLKSLIVHNNNDVFNIMLDMLVFEKALQLLRSGYLVNTGLGHQGYELKLHLIVSNFINSYIQKTVDKAKEDFYTEQEIEDYLKEEIFWCE